VDVQLMPTGINETTGTLVAVAFESGCHTLICRASQYEKRKERGDGSGRPPQTREKRRHTSA